MTYLKLVVLHSAQRTFTSPGPWPLSSDKRRLVPRVAENELLGPARWQQPNAGRFLRSQLDVRLSKLFDPRSRRVRYLRHFVYDASYIFLYGRSHSAQSSNMLTRPVGPLRKVRITDDLSLVHVVQLVNHHQKLHRYAHGTFVCLHRLPCRRAATTVCRRRSVGRKARWLRARAAQTGPSSTGTVTVQAHTQHEADGAWSSLRPRQAQQRHIACRVPLDAGAHAHAVHMHEYATSTDLAGSEHEVDAEEGDGCIQSVAECHACERS